MNWLPWRRRGASAEAKKAVDDSREANRRAEERAVRAKRVFDALEVLNEADHFDELLANTYGAKGR